MCLKICLLFQTYINPEKKRDDALEAGFTYQINYLPQSKAGYIGFGSHIATQANYPTADPPLSGDHTLAPVLVTTGQSQLANIVNLLKIDVENEINCGGSNYKTVLDKAIEWLDDSSICPHKEKGIIFISDGEPSGSTDPNPTAQQINYLKNYSIPVHGIFLGNSMGTVLQDLANQTGGSSWLVPPSSTDTLSTVIKNIVKQYTVEFISKGVTLSNQTINSIATGYSSCNIDDTTWIVILNNPVALKPGLNQLYLNALFGSPDTNVYDTTLQLNFYIDVTLDTPYTSECYKCWYRTQIKVVEPNTNVGIDTLTSQHNQYKIQLEYYSSDTTLKEVDIVVRTTQKGDLDTFTIGNPSFDGVKYIFEQTVPFNVTTGNAIPGNGTTESDLSDNMSLYWQHPEEVLDTAFKIIPVIPPTLAKNHYLSLYQQQIKLAKYKKHQNIDILFSNPINYVEASLISPSGRELSHCKGFNTQRLTLNIGNAANGIYFLKLSSGTEKLIRKIVLSH